MGVALGPPPWDRAGANTPPAPRPEGTDTIYGQLWDTLTSIQVPVLLARGMRPDSVLGDDDEEELRKRVPSARIVHFDQAGHSIQGDSPLELAATIEDFVFTS